MGRSDSLDVIPDVGSLTSVSDEVVQFNVLRDDPSFTSLRTMDSFTSFRM
ncbi:hypothetical protein HETIRDRAFT_171824 [Heterobasidion irregulare TC 32-1]|uniref:Uncharacterized protein n=1 Tax=Heterobasidion irregulare (strain TC 32-1) TaxID=747525 RepID=W4K1E4_HETIT|nr:uncharacterized protein HETIRDRAFT_171824 [Heterobasidion irregulare TC 32-1]ETW79648.1 hypothetical protein HETIRDRAFT_171824 [Heterobasidion irregulare TC 32-1]